jgi:hypothetical protein
MRSEFWYNATPGSKSKQSQDLRELHAFLYLLAGSSHGRVLDQKWN